MESTQKTKPKALIIGISGPSSSGKTTLSRLLHTLFPSTTIIHEDDFYRPESEIPVRAADGVQDWDCVEALDIPAMVSCLETVRRTGVVPSNLQSKEDKNDHGPVPISPSTLESLKSLISTWTSPSQPGSILLPSPSNPTPISLIILDGFLLYTPSLSPIFPLLSIKIFLPTPQSLVKSRREKRNGYVTLEGFWKDPEGYVDNVVWPNYVRDHKWLFEHGYVEGRVRGDVEKDVGEGGLWCFEGDGEGEGERDMEGVLRWAVGRLMDVLPGMVGELVGEEKDEDKDGKGEI